MTWDGMDPMLARMALRQTGVLEAFALLAYVEGYALVVGSVGVRLVPSLVARQAVTSVVDGFSPWHPSTRTFPAQLRAVAHELMADRLRIEARARALVQGDGAIESVRLVGAQLGDLTGVAELAHAAGELMPFIRSGDAALTRAAVMLSEDMRRRIAALSTEPDDIAPARTAAARERIRASPSLRVEVPSAPLAAVVPLLRNGDEPKDQT